MMPTDMRGMTKPVYCAMAQIIQRVRRGGGGVGRGGGGVGAFGVWGWE